MSYVTDGVSAMRQLWKDLLVYFQNQVSGVLAIILRHSLPALHCKILLELRKSEALTELHMILSALLMRMRIWLSK